MNNTYYVRRLMKSYGISCHVRKSKSNAWTHIVYVDGGQSKKIRNLFCDLQLVHMMVGFKKVGIWYNIKTKPKELYNIDFALYLMSEREIRLIYTRVYLKNSAC